MLATAFSGLLAAGIFAGLDGVKGHAGWRWLFIIEGGVSFFAGLVAVLTLPDFPDSKTSWRKWLFTADECQLAIDRMQRDHVSTTESNRGVWYGLKLAAADFRVWIFVSSGRLRSGSHLD